MILSLDCDNIVNTKVARNSGQIERRICFTTSVTESLKRKDLDQLFSKMAKMLAGKKENEEL